MKKQPHHRSLFRTGPEHRWLQRKTYHLLKFGKPGFVGLRIRREMRTIRPGLYEIPPALVLEWREALADFEPYALDSEGTVWT